MALRLGAHRHDRWTVHLWPTRLSRGVCHLNIYVCLAPGVFDRRVFWKCSKNCNDIEPIWVLTRLLVGGRDRLHDLYSRSLPELTNRRYTRQLEYVE